MPRKMLLVMTLLLTLGAATAASASKPIREVFPGQPDGVISGQCAFPVLGHIEGPEIIKTFVNAAGDPMKQIVTFPGNKITLTNVRTGTSVTVLGTGSSQLRARPDGSFSARTMGHGPFFPNPLTGERGIWYLSGQGASTLDPGGNVTSATLHGRLVDLCSRLAT
jgi:hypothetical protein